MRIHWTTSLALCALLCVSLVLSAGATEEKESKTLTETVKNIVTSKIGARDGDGPVPIALPGADSLDVATGILDQILLTPDPYYYVSLGRRDPFVSLVNMDEAETGDMDISGDQRSVPGPVTSLRSSPSAV